MTATGEKMTLLAEIIRISVKGATESEIGEELSLSPSETETYLRFLMSRRLVTMVDGGDYFPSQKGLAYLSTYDDAADMVDLEGPHGFYSGAKSQAGVYWDRAELAARMRDIIGR